VKSEYGIAPRRFGCVDAFSLEYWIDDGWYAGGHDMYMNPKTGKKAPFFAAQNSKTVSANSFEISSQSEMNDQVKWALKDFSLKCLNFSVAGNKFCFSNDALKTSRKGVQETGKLFASQTISGRSINLFRNMQGFFQGGAWAILMDVKYTTSEQVASDCNDMPSLL
jgi:hypothetical protein